MNKNNIPYQRYVEIQPWFEVEESIYETPSATHITHTTLVTPKGQMGVIKMLKKNFT